MSILATQPHPKAPLHRSMDFDFYPMEESEPGEVTELIQHHLGHYSPFAEEHGWYVESVGPWTTMNTPPGWQSRLVAVQTAQGTTGWCLAPIDLAFNKIEAARPKDMEHLVCLLQNGYVDKDELAQVIKLHSGSEERYVRHLQTLAEVQNLISAQDKPAS